jgi:hypothetical protein
MDDRIPVIASEAKQSRSQEGSLDCFVAPLLAMTARVVALPYSTALTTSAGCEA